MLKKTEIERARKRWFLRVVLTFFAIGAALAGGEWARDYYGIAEARLQLLFPVAGVIYLFQIFSYRKIKCPSCGIAIFNPMNLLVPVPEECRGCRLKIDR